MINEENPQSRGQGQRKIRGQVKVAKALPQVSPLTDVGDKCKGGRGKKCEADPLNEPHHQEGPKGFGQKIGHCSNGKEDRADNHDTLFGMS